MDRELERAVKVPSAADCMKTEPRLARLVALCKEEMQAEEVWLFGSRARGDEGPYSDWDVLAIIPDDAPPEIDSLRRAFQVRRKSGVHADLLTARRSDFNESTDTVNTIAYDVAREGLRLDSSD